MNFNTSHNICLLPIFVLHSMKDFSSSFHEMSINAYLFSFFKKQPFIITHQILYKDQLLLQRANFPDNKK